MVEDRLNPNEAFNVQAEWIAVKGSNELSIEIISVVPQIRMNQTIILHLTFQF